MLVLSVLNLFNLARVYLAVFILWSMCCFSVMLLSIVTHRILVLVVYGILDPFIFTRAFPWTLLALWWYKTMFDFSLFVLISHFDWKLSMCISSVCMFCLRCDLIVWFVSSVMSSAYCRTVVFVFCGLRMSFVYRMNKVGERADFVLVTFKLFILETYYIFMRVYIILYKHLII